MARTRYNVMCRISYSLMFNRLLGRNATGTTWRSTTGKEEYTNCMYQQHTLVTVDPEIFAEPYFGEKISVLQVIRSEVVCPDGLVRHILWKQDRTVCCEFIQCNPGFQVEFCHSSWEKDTCKKCPRCTELNHRSDSIFWRKCTPISGCYAEPEYSQSETEKRNPGNISTSSYFESLINTATTRQENDTTTDTDQISTDTSSTWIVVTACTVTAMICSGTLLIRQLFLRKKSRDRKANEITEEEDSAGYTLPMTVQNEPSQAQAHDNNEGHYTNPYCSVSPALQADRNYSDLNEIVYIDVIQ